jgi:ribosome maturation protein SDO1
LILDRIKREKDIDEVLQTHTVFVNVSKGEVARKEDLVKAFAVDDQTKICQQILDKGELQISEKERQQQIESAFKEVASIISDKCINPESHRPYPVSMIEKTMKQVHFSVKLTKSTKQQALELIKKLKELIPIERAQMKLKVITSKKNKQQLTAMASAGFETQEMLEDGLVEWVSDIIIITKIDLKKQIFKHECIDYEKQVFLTDPGHYRAIDNLVKSTPKSQLHVLSLKEVEEVDEELD